LYLSEVPVTFPAKNGLADAGTVKASVHTSICPDPTGKLSGLVGVVGLSPTDTPGPPSGPTSVVATGAGTLFEPLNPDSEHDRTRIQTVSRKMLIF
jgi:hypothetical protein